eukprot:Colp12_sorted_trinity150504_noHs@18824
METPVGLDLYSRYALAGAQCAAITHLVLVPVDVIKTRLQIRPDAYKGLFHATSVIAKQEGFGALMLGFNPTGVGYALQGACKFGFYEYFKSVSIDVFGYETAAKYKTAVYMTSAAAAEVIGTIALCPWEALRIRVVSDPTFATGMVDGIKKIHGKEGVRGMYKGIVPILLKQLPYTMTQLAVFQHAVELAYTTILPTYTPYKSKKDMTTQQQLAVSVGSGIVAGVVSAIASHPADTVLSRVNDSKHVNSKSPVADVLKELGFRGLWHGLGTRCLMVGALSAGMFLIYDSVKVMCGLPTTTGFEKKKQ